MVNPSFEYFESILPTEQEIALPLYDLSKNPAKAAHPAVADQKRNLMRAELDLTARRYYFQLDENKFVVYAD